MLFLRSCCGCWCLLIDFDLVFCLEPGTYVRRNSRKRRELEKCRRKYPGGRERRVINSDVFGVKAMFGFCLSEGGLVDFSRFSFFLLLNF